MQDLTAYRSSFTLHKQGTVLCTLCYTGPCVASLPISCYHHGWPLWVNSCQHVCVCHIGMLGVKETYWHNVGDVHPALGCYPLQQQSLGWFSSLHSLYTKTAARFLTLCIIFSRRQAISEQEKETWRPWQWACNRTWDCRGMLFW